MGKSLTHAICVLWQALISNENQKNLSLGSKGFETSPSGVGCKILSIWWGCMNGLEKSENLTKHVYDNF